MDSALSKILGLLLENGLLGAAVLLLGWIVYLQYQENKRLTERLLEEREKRVELAKGALQSVQASSLELKQSNALLLSIASALPPKRS